LWLEDDLAIFQRPTIVMVASSAPDNSICALPALLRDIPDVKSLYVESDGKGPVPVNSRFRLTEPTAFANIEELYFSRINVDDAALADLWVLPRLRLLEICGNLPVNSPHRGLGHIGKCQDLEDLRIEETTLTDGELAQLTGLTHLRFLLIQSTQLTDSAMDTLAKLGSLEHLSFSESKNVTDPAISKLLPQLPNLKTFGAPGVLSPQTVQLLEDRYIPGY
jgi:hypothetical protein